MNVDRISLHIQGISGYLQLNGEAKKYCISYRSQVDALYKIEHLVFQPKNDLLHVYEVTIVDCILFLF